MSSDTWPPALKNWVAKCLGQMTDANRKEAQEELRIMIQEAFNAQTLWTTDWAGMQLPSLQPKVPSVFNRPNSLKRKADTSTSPVKKKKQPAPALVPKPAPVYVDSSPMADLSAKEKRARRFERELEIEKRRGIVVDPSPSFTGNDTPPFQRNPLTLRGRIQRDILEAYPSEEVAPDISFQFNKHKPIVGRSQKVFKEYLRMTDMPNPDNVRPLHVLEEACSAVKTKWRKEKNYNWTCSQFKSMRQDMKVQGINNNLTIDVYQSHARVALEHGDLVEFNQCLQQLRQLFADGLEGKKNEFTSYFMLFMLHARQRSELNSLIGELTPEEKASVEIQHALAVSTAISTNNYYSLFQLYDNVPETSMGAYIMDWFIPRARALALIVMCKAYRSISLAFLSRELSFDGGVDEAHTFLTTLNAACYINPNAHITERNLDVKTCGSAVMNVYEEKFQKVIIKGSI